MAKTVLTADEMLVIAIETERHQNIVWACRGVDGPPYQPIAQY